MKVVLLISLVHLLLAISTPCTNANEPVRDTKGELVRPGTKYYVMSAIRGFYGGGVRRGPTYNANSGVCNSDYCCPYEVVQSLDDEDKGMPIILEGAVSKVDPITESTNLTVRFSIRNPLICNNTVWKVEKGEISFLSTNGNPSKADAWFQIKRNNEFSYKFVDSASNSPVGITLYNGERRLVLDTNEIFQAVFIKDTRDGINSII
ncbi:hypothetical protein HAX54_048400 [Datura stramonium]|uniref:Uncharacterized protein n=1 Tax=Datura stramonium TaxID=4076 RepID=A0ABS8WLS9_DATST|nr:hypothetical protein [Datura stramonium]